VVPVKDAHDLDAPPEIFKTTPEISTILPSSAGVLVADIYGTIHILNREFEAQRTWVAYEGGRVTHMAERRGVLVTVGVRVLRNIHCVSSFLSRMMSLPVRLS
jgi:hypothetical protein